MNTTSFEPLLRNAVIRAIDTVSKKAETTERAAAGPIWKLLRRWNEMDTPQKEHVAGIVVTTAIAAVGAIATMKGRGKTVKKTAKKVVRKVM